jgi:hypothetical protein
MKNILFSLLFSIILLSCNCLSTDCPEFSIKTISIKIKTPQVENTLIDLTHPYSLEKVSITDEEGQNVDILQPLKIINDKTVMINLLKRPKQIKLSSEDKSLNETINLDYSEIATERECCGLDIELKKRPICKVSRFSDPALQSK